MRRGFTLIELLVAIGIVVLMFLIINQLFFRTSQAVSTGVAVADIVASSRVVSEQIERDFKFQVGPDHASGTNASGGVLVIANQMLYNAPDPANGLPRGIELAKPYGPDSSEEYRSGDVVYRTVRSDHLMFIREVQPGELPTTPANATTFTSFDDGGLAQYQVVRYQHGKRIDADNPINYTYQLGSPGPDARATDWILTRQALFLGEQDIDASPDTNTPTYYAGSAAYNAAVENNFPLYAGTTDYAYFSLSDINHPNGCLVGEAPALNNPGIQLISTLNADEYHDLAVGLYTFTNTRLHVNVAPNSWESRVVAQQHPYLVEHVSDFIVEFAADIHTGDTVNGTPDGAVDLDATVPGMGLPDPATGTRLDYVGGNIRWYGFWYNDPERNERRVVLPNGAFGTDVFDPEQPAIYEPPTSWEPYRPADGSFVFRHDDKDGQRIPGYDSNVHKHASLWPYMLRIRYRHHDKRGIVKQGNNQHGMWFEQIVRVNR